MGSGNRTFPGTYEADIAQLRLGLLYLDSPVPQYEKAMSIFQDVEKQGSTPEKRYLKALGIVGQSFVLNRENKRNDAATVLQRLYFVFEGMHGEEELEAAIDEGPRNSAISTVAATATSERAQESKP